VTGRLLLVEDNELNRDMLSRRLRRAGFEVALAADGEEALAAVRAQRPDLMLLDMNLPVLDGWSVCERVRQTPEIADIPIIALTAHAMAEDRERAIACGCDDYATKPMDFPQLLRQISGLLQPMSLRRRLTLSLFTILVLFAINVGTHFWGSYARSESMVAYRQSVSAGQVSGELANSSTPSGRRSSSCPRCATTRTTRWAAPSALRPSPRSIAIRDSHGARRAELGRHGAAVRAPARQPRTLLDSWQAFYERYNDASWDGNVDDPIPYLETSQRLQGTRAAPGIHRRAAGRMSSTAPSPSRTALRSSASSPRSFLRRPRLLPRALHERQR
jgi:two-component system cell cycle response regulator DivK